MEGPFVMHIWTCLPELRVPLELALLHFSFLTVLDRQKDIIGQVQYRWLAYACSKLGLSRFLLPYSRDSVAQSQAADTRVQMPMKRPPEGWSLQPSDNAVRNFVGYFYYCFLGLLRILFAFCCFHILIEAMGVGTGGAFRVGELRRAS